ncbi:hypothetical protein J3R83DRAFT_9142 [Lanmaoa asiatica]|nr:hypothetical protein J3R83DRAFT_9142 [Lanmaoa asiatica]
METSTPSKRIKLDPSPSPSPNDENPKDSIGDLDSLEQVHCTICLQSFLDRTIIPVCAHEFCFECILLWSGACRSPDAHDNDDDDQAKAQSFFCRTITQMSPLLEIVRQFVPHSSYSLATSLAPTHSETHGESANGVAGSDNSARKQTSSKERLLDDDGYTNTTFMQRSYLFITSLRNRPFDPRLQHIASNPYTRYRPFPTPAQFSASPDLISRMTIFLRRELRVWPNLDVEFLTTYTISLMKSIDVRSESAVKLLSEFLDLDTPYTAGERHVNAEHFAHEIYSYLRSPYRDLNTYDQIAQYDTPPEISPPREIERGSRWSAERSPSRRSRPQSHPRDQSSIHLPAARHGRGSSAEARREDEPSSGHSRNRSPRSIMPDREDHDPRNHPSSRRHSPRDGVQGILRNCGHSGRMSHPEASSSVVLAENQDNNFPVQPHSRGDDKGKGQATENTDEPVPATDATKMSALQGDDSAAVGEAGVTRFINGPLEGTGDDYVDKARDGSSANPQPSRKRSAGLSVHIHPRNRTLPESVQAYLSRPAAPWHPTKKPSVLGDEQPKHVSDTGAISRSTTDARSSLLLRLTDGAPSDPDIGKLPSSQTTTRTANDDPSASTPNDTTSEQHHGCRSQCCALLSNRSCSSTAAQHASAVAQCGGDATEGPPPVPSVAPLTRNANVTLSHVSALEGSLVDEHREAAQTQHGESRGPGCHFHMETGGARDTGDQARSEPTNDDALHLHSDLLGPHTLSAASALLDDHAHDHKHKDGFTNMDTWPAVEVSTEAITAAPLFFFGDKSAACEAGRMAAGEPRDDASGDNSAFEPGSGSGSMSTSTSASMQISSSSASTDTGASELETRLRARARLRVRLAAIKEAGTVGSVGSTSVSGLRVRVKNGLELGETGGWGRPGRGSL